MSNLIIGSHVSFKSDDQLIGSVKEALSYGSNTFMFYTGAPQNTKRVPIDDMKTYEALKFSIFAKFFTDTDMEYTNLFRRRIYQLRAKKCTRTANNGKQDWNNIILMLLKASLKENSNEN